MSDDTFFCIKPVSCEAGFDAIVLLGEYNIKFTMLLNEARDMPGVIVARKTGDEPEAIVMGEAPDEVHEYHVSNFRLAEMAFQLNYEQVGVVCPVCEKEGLDICGHLTFSSLI